MSESTPSACSAGNCQDKLALTYAALITRVWLAVRALQTGVEKFAGTKASEQAVTVDGAPNEYGLTAGASVKTYALEHYHGVPEALMSKFTAEPFMPAWGLKIYDFVLGPALLILGLTILLGIASRTSLFLLGLLYISLTWGLILIKEDGGVAWLGTHMILIAMALMLSQHDRFKVLQKW